MRILLTGHSGSYNRGCEAIVRCTLDIISRYVGPAQIYLKSEDPPSDYSALISDFRNLQIIDASNAKKYSLQWLVSRIHRRVLRGIPQYCSSVNRHLYRNSDVVISVGGDTFTDDYDEGPSEYFQELAFARSYGALTVIWAASIGPFLDKRHELKWAKELRKVDLITVRENASLEYLTQIGVTENVRLVADPAFLLPNFTKGAFFIERSHKERIVGIGISGRVSRYGSSTEKYLSAFEAFGNTLLSDGYTRLIIIPHVFGNPKTSDLPICQQLGKRLNRPDRIIHLSTNHNAGQTKYVISQCDYFIGARMHSTIASLSNFVPTITIAYSRKAHGINRVLFGHTDFVLPIEQVSKSSLMNKFCLLRDNRDEIIEHLKLQVPKLRNMADLGGKYLAEMSRKNAILLQTQATGMMSQ